MELSSAPSCSRGGLMAVQLTSFPGNCLSGWRPAGSGEACPQQPHLRRKRDPLPTLRQDELPSPRPPSPPPPGKCLPCLFLAPQTLGSLIPGVLRAGPGRAGIYWSRGCREGKWSSPCPPPGSQHPESISSRVSVPVMGCSLSLIKNAPSQGGLPAGHCRHHAVPAGCSGHSQGRRAGLQRSSKIAEVFLNSHLKWALLPLKEKKKKNTQRGIAVACGSDSLSGRLLLWEVHVCFQEMLRHQANSGNSTLSFGGMAMDAGSLPPREHVT